MLCARHLLWLPPFLMPDHGAQDRQHLAHAGRQGDLPRCTQARIKRFDHRIIAHGHERTQV
jgi:hypothetical protein